MSSSLNSPIADVAVPRDASELKYGCGQSGNNRLASKDRRSFLLALLAAPLLCVSERSHANSELLAGLKRWGSGEFRRFGFLVYEATLWAGDDPQRPPLALRLDYKRSIDGKAIAEASVKEMRPFVADEALLNQWGEQMQRIFPDVKPGDHILGVYRSNGARFYQGDRLIGAIGAPGFAEAFFSIWLDARTSAPELRAALLRRG